MARPLVLIVAAAVFEELQVAELVRFCVVPSVYVPVAVNCSVAPAARVVPGPVTDIDTSVAAVTVSATVFEVMPFCAALMLLDPIATPAARPVVDIVAAAVFEELQFAELVRFWVVPSLKVPVGVN